MTAIQIYFSSKELVPDDPKLKKALRAVYPVYKDILASIEAYPREWKFYGAKYGWQLKATHKGKALLYLIPQEGAFRLGFAVRDIEKEALLNSKLPAKLKGELAVAKRYPEGWPLHLDVKKASDMKAVSIVVDTLKSLRT